MPTQIKKNNGKLLLAFDIFKPGKGTDPPIATAEFIR